MGGNVGTQSSSITVRGLATGHIRANKIMTHIFREVLVGLSIGIILGLIVSVASYYWQADHYIGLIVGIAMWFNVSFAATLGAVVPILFKKMGIDPAIASAPFISTTIDILGLINYFFVVILLVKLFY
jgi:magnesium transporter